MNGGSLARIPKKRPNTWGFPPPSYTAQLHHHQLWDRHPHESILPAPCIGPGVFGGEGATAEIHTEKWVMWYYSGDFELFDGV